MSTPAFQTPQTNPFDLTDVGVASAPTFADLDGDGDLDALVGNRNDGILYFENTGSASSAAFAAAVTNPFGLTKVGSNSTPTFADLDGDGDLDALVGQNTGLLYYFENTGSAGSAAFSAAVTNPFGLTDVGYFSAPTFADLDADGDLDALVGASDGTLNYFENTGSASSAAFASAQNASAFGLTAVAGFSKPTFADLDGDGDLDVLVGEFDGILNYFENTGSASAAAFSAAVTNPFGLTDVGNNSAPTFADLDGDGDLDALVGDGDGNTLFFENGTPPGVTITPSGDSIQVTEGGASDTYTVVLDTLPTANVTITLDTQHGGTGNGQVSVNTPTLTFTTSDWDTAQTVTVSAVDDGIGEGPHFGVIAHSVSSADTGYNGLSVDNLSVQISDNDLPSGDPTFQAPVTNPFDLGDVGSNSTPTLADLDGDGDLDALVGAYDGTLNYFENTGSASSAAFASAQDASAFGLTDVGSLSKPTFADLDGDGDLDALVGQGDGTLNYFENTGSASSAAFASAENASAFGLTNVGSRSAPTFADLDGDGDLDALVGEKGEKYDILYYFENTGSASSAAFAAAVTNPFGLTDVGSYSAPTFADLDGDGDLDALVGERFGNLMFFENGTPPGVTLSPSGDSNQVTEGGASDTYTVVLNSQPTADVTITLASPNGQVSVDQATLTFTTANWDTAQTVTVSAVDDGIGEGPHFGV
ncbi:MAG: FG-GAP-like repeat-containing protein, partial [Lamprobacter sp.]|uniref:FG-GAP-like repeat-containing protein n=1 Tax=Lamprobacter sp. TaxID=3100796 RepID=UPI002B25852D